MNSGVFLVAFIQQVMCQHALCGGMHGELPIYSPHCQYAAWVETCRHLTSSANQSAEVRCQQRLWFVGCNQADCHWHICKICADSTLMWPRGLVIKAALLFVVLRTVGRFSFPSFYHVCIRFNDFKLKNKNPGVVTWVISFFINIYDLVVSYNSNHQINDLMFFDNCNEIF